MTQILLDNALETIAKLEERIETQTELIEKQTKLIELYTELSSRQEEHIKNLHNMVDLLELAIKEIDPELLDT